MKLERNAASSEVATVIASLPLSNQVATATNTVIFDSIAKAKPKPKPLIPKKYCQYPHQPNMDMFDLSEGLGKVSLKSSIDSLNNFKENCIRDIKTKIQSMGPEGSRDSKLAAGAIKTLKEITEAVKCFVETANNVNNLVTAYVNGITSAITQVTNTINLLTSQIATIKAMFNPDTLAAELIREIAPELLSQLNNSTGIIDLINVVNDLSNEMNNAQNAVRNLGNLQKRSFMQINCSLSLLKNSLNEMSRMLSLRASLQQSLNQASSFYVSASPATFLEGVPYLGTGNESLIAAIENAGFSWSLTNSGNLTNYNISDELSVLPKLGDMCKNFSGNAKPYIIASSDIVGTIVVPEDSPGLIQCGLDPGCGPSVSIVMELYINDGMTIIRSEARGSGENVYGKYYAKGSNVIEYYSDSIIQIEDDYYELMLINTDSMLQGAEYYYFDPINIDSQPLGSFVIESVGKSSVKGYWSNLSSDVRYNTPVNNLVPLYVRDGDNGYVTVDENGNQYYKNAVGEPTLDKHSADGGDNDKFYLTDLPDAHTDVFGHVSRWTYYYNTQIKLFVVEYMEKTIRLTKKDSTINPSGIPHVGEQIAARNWILQVYPSGSPEEIRAIDFTKHVVWMKAHWGFVPQSV